MEHADPTDLLSNEGLDRANVKSPFVLNDCTNLALPALAKRLSAVLASADRTTMFLYAQYAAVRAGEPKRYGPRGSSARDDEGAQEIRAGRLEACGRARPRPGAQGSAGEGSPQRGAEAQAGCLPRAARRTRRNCTRGRNTTGRSYFCLAYSSAYGRFCNRPS